MSLENFDFPFHRVSTQYPDRGNRVKLGNNWSHTVRPHTPAARTFKLSFPVLKYFDDGHVTTGREAQIDLAKLESFYLAHEMHETFLYEHPVHGILPVKFKTPLVIPEGTVAGDGAVENVSIELEEQLTL